MPSSAAGSEQDLHSSPTRRSSDLDVLARDLLRTGQGELLIAPADSAVRDLHRRSEEHTSELQSLRHLVCRLLRRAPSKISTLPLHDALPILMFSPAIFFAQARANC